MQIPFASVTQLLGATIPQNNAVHKLCPPGVDITSLQEKIICYLVLRKDSIVCVIVMD